MDAPTLGKDSKQSSKIEIHERTSDLRIVCEAPSDNEAANEGSDAPADHAQSESSAPIFCATERSGAADSSEPESPQSGRAGDSDTNADQSCAVKSSDDAALSPEPARSGGKPVAGSVNRKTFFIILLILSMVSGAYFSTPKPETLGKSPDELCSMAWAEWQSGLRKYNDSEMQAAAKRAIKLYDLAAAHGAAKAYVGKAFLQKFSLHDLAGAKATLEVGARAGSASALFNLATAYDGTGYGNPAHVDLKKAFELYQASALRGNEAAQAKLSYLYFGGQQIAPDTNKAFYWARKAAESGDSYGMLNLGLFYAQGIGCKTNAAKAVYWLSRAMQCNMPCGSMVGDYYYYGAPGVSRDYVKAAQYYTLAARMGDGKSMYQLGRMMEEGKGLRKDIERAYRQYQLATPYSLEAELRGNAMLRDGIGCYPGDPQLGHQRLTELFSHFCDQKDMPSYQYLLGQCYENGWGVKKNLATTIDYYRKSAAQGQFEAIKQLESLGVKSPVSGILDFSKLEPKTPPMSCSLVLDCFDGQLTEPIQMHEAPSDPPFPEVPEEEPGGKPDLPL